MNTQSGRLSSDFYNWVYIYAHATPADLWTCFGYPGLHHLYHIPFYLTYKLFHFNEWAWHLIFIGLHVLNGLLLLVLSQRILHFFALNKKLSYVIASLFLFSPYQTEVVAWGACIHYLLMTAFLLSSLICLVDFCIFKRTISLVLFHVFFVFSLFTMEQSYLFPLIYLLFAWIFTSRKKTKVLLQIIISQSILFIIYFTIAKLSFGSFIGHYGASSHLHVDISQLSNNLMAYAFKFLFFLRTSFQPFDDIIIKLSRKWFVKGFLVTAFVFMCGYAFYVHAKKKLFLLVLVLSFTFALAPVLNLAMDSHWSIQTDRYSYVPSIFVYIFIGIFINYFSKNIQYIVSAVLIIISGVSLWQMNNAWRENGILKNDIIRQFPINEKRNIYLVNQPDNHKGAHLFRNGLPAVLDLRYGLNLKKTERLQFISAVNTTTLQDSITIHTNGNKLHVSLNKWGRWIHDINHEQKAFDVQAKEVDFDMIIKEFSKDKDALYYLKGGTWHVYEF